MFKLHTDINKYGEMKIKKIDFNTNTSELLANMGLIARIIVDNDPTIKNEIETLKMLENYFEQKTKKGSKNNGRKSSSK